MKVASKSIVRNSLVDGPGKRDVVFFQGCSIRCKGCQNKHLQDAQYGVTVSVKELAFELAVDGCKNITISGGEPFDQVQDLAQLVKELKKTYFIDNIIVYTGYKFEELRIHYTEIWDYIDVLVDGEFRKEEDDEFIIYRGSRNQRAIDVSESVRTGQIVVLDWDNPEVTIDENGDAYAPNGIASMFENEQETRMCGQTKGAK